MLCDGVRPTRPTPPDCVVETAVLTEIVAELENPAGAMGSVISEKKVREWMTTTDVDAMGALYALLSEPGQVARIKPSIDKYEVSAFLRRYFERCITENPESEWADSRYSAGWDIARWLKHWTKSKDLDSDELAEWATWLGELYKKGDSAIQLSIETAILEHVLDDPAIAQLFADWPKDPQLADGYQKCLHGPGALPE
jgi:hypothetical protein